ncbi:MAG: hypothetical protein AAGL89_07855 [Pseudomonadota bacterium]
MQPIALFPSQTNLKRGLGIGVVCLAVFGYFRFFATASDLRFLGLIFLGFGGFFVARCGWLLLNPTAMFEANETGFSVKGKRWRPWAEFRGVSVVRASSGIGSLSQTVQVSVGRSILGGSVKIWWYEMSGPAMEMASAIGRYAEVARHVGAVETVPQPTAMQTPAPRHEPAPVAAQPAAPAGPQGAASFTPRANQPTDPLSARLREQAGGGPIQSVPSFGQRLFGRAK